MYLHNTLELSKLETAYENYFPRGLIQTKNKLQLSDTQIPDKENAIHIGRLFYHLK